MYVCIHMHGYIYYMLCNVYVCVYSHAWIYIYISMHVNTHIHIRYTTYNIYIHACEYTHTYTLHYNVFFKIIIHCFYYGGPRSFFLIHVFLMNSARAWRRSEFIICRPPPVARVLSTKVCK